MSEIRAAPVEFAPPARPEAEESDCIGKGDFVYRDSPVVPVFESSAGSRLRAADGRVFLDMEAANGALAFGYDRALFREAFDRGAHLPTVPSFVESAPRLRLARKLVDRFERELGVRGRVAFEIGGAQGIELALKIAHAANGRDGAAVFEGAYHGRSIYTSRLGGSRRYGDVAPRVSAEVFRLPYPNCEECRFGQQRASCARQCVDYVGRTLRDDRFGMSSPSRFPVGAFLFEPILNVGGMCEPDPDYLRASIGAFRDRGAMIIADEIFTGFYRTGPFLGVQRSGVMPDIVVISKALTNGMAPLSCVWARDDLLSPERFPPGSHSVTFANTPFCLTVAETVVDRFDGWTSVEADVAVLQGRLGRLGEAAASHPLVESTATFGAIARLKLRRPVAAAVRAAALRVGEGSGQGAAGMLLASTGAAPDTICLHPPLTAGAEDIEEATQLLLRALDAAGVPEEVR